MTTASRFELWFEPKPKGNETMAQVFHRTLDVGIACLKECESVEECAKLVTTELMYKLMAPNISALVRAQNPANTTEFLQAAGLYISGSRLDRSKLWDQRGGRQHFTPYRYPFKEQQPSSPQNTTAPSASPQFRQSNQLTQPAPQPTNHSNPSGLFKKVRRYLQQKPHRLSKYFDDKKGPLCFQCKNWGHLSTVCPEKEVCRVEQSQHPQYTQPRLPSLFAMGKVASMLVRFFLDSGADLTIVSDGLVHELARNGTCHHQKCPCPFYFPTNDPFIM